MDDAFRSLTGRAGGEATRGFIVSSSKKVCPGREEESEKGASGGKALNVVQRKMEMTTYTKKEKIKRKGSRSGKKGI